MNIQVIVTVVILVVVLAAAIFMLYSYLKDRTIEEIRGDVYRLFLQAERTYLKTGTGKQKMKWVINQTRSILPFWARTIITDQVLEKIVESWFRAVKDLLDDGKINKSEEGK